MLFRSEALKMIKSIFRNLKDSKDENDYSNYTFISSWSNNYNSWKSASKIKKLFIKYEDLELNRDETFLKILNFVNELLNKKDEIDEKKLRNSIKSTNFDVLKKEEEKHGFSESVYSLKDNKKRIFFNLGNKNNYKNLLKQKTIEEIEKEFNKEMKEIGYL